MIVGSKMFNCTHQPNVVVELNFSVLMFWRNLSIIFNSDSIDVPIMDELHPGSTGWFRLESAGHLLSLEALLRRCLVELPAFVSCNDFGLELSDLVESLLKKTHINCFVCYFFDVLLIKQHLLQSSEISFS